MACPSLNTLKFQQPRATINKIHTHLHSIAISALLYYRALEFFHRDSKFPVFAWGLMLFSELIFSFGWLLAQAFRWKPVVRSVSPENLPDDSKLPGIDVFICTADPRKEPTIEVMNTVLSAMAIDYPPDKLAVYLSDDGGAALTLYAMQEACSFAKSWIPFCRKYGIKIGSPDAYFTSFHNDERHFSSDEFKTVAEEIKSAYELLKQNLEKAQEKDNSVVHDRPPRIEVINDDTKMGGNQAKMPLLVYVSREKRQKNPHRVKAGALNTLLRVSGIMSNAPYILVLDCDMYCNDPASAKQAMCFHLDTKLSTSLSYVQFPQIFYNASKNDIYDGQARSAYKTQYQGMDAAGGTVCCGAGYYLKKKALYSHPNQQVDSSTDLFNKIECAKTEKEAWQTFEDFFDNKRYFQDEFHLEPEKKFGQSSMFVASLTANHEQEFKGMRSISEAILEEAKTLASCSFEKDTKWGKEIGYSYDCPLESTYTGYLLHCKGWKSVYLYPERPCFLGCTTIEMKDALVQLMEWSSGLIQVGLSRFSPLTYGMSRMSLLQSMCYGYLTLWPLLSFPLLIYGSVPQLCFVYGIPLFPKVSSPWFAAFAVVFISSLLQHLYEVLSSGGSVKTWWNEQRIWMVKSVTASWFGCLDALLKKLGVAKANFRLTNKAIDQEKLQEYEKGRFGFQGAKIFMVPLTLVVILNVACLIGGLKGVVTERNFDGMFSQIFLSSYIFVLSYPVLQELITRVAKRKK